MDLDLISSTDDDGKVQKPNVNDYARPTKDNLVHIRVEEKTVDKSVKFDVPVEYANHSEDKNPVLSPVKYILKIPTSSVVSTLPCSFQTADSNNDIPTRSRPQDLSCSRKKRSEEFMTEFTSVCVTSSRGVKHQSLNASPVISGAIEIASKSCVECQTQTARDVKVIKSCTTNIKLPFQLYCVGNLIYHARASSMITAHSSFPIFFMNGQHAWLKNQDKKSSGIPCCVLLKPDKAIAALLLDDILPGNYLFTKSKQIPTRRISGKGKEQRMFYEVIHGTLSPFYFSVEDLWKGGCVLKLRHFTEKEHPQCLFHVFSSSGDDRWFVDTNKTYDWLAKNYPSCTHDLFPVLQTASLSLNYRGKPKKNDRFNIKIQVLSTRAKRRRKASPSSSCESVHST